MSYFRFSSHLIVQYCIVLYYVFVCVTWSVIGLRLLLITSCYLSFPACTVCCEKNCLEYFARGNVWIRYVCINASVIDFVCWCLWTTVILCGRPVQHLCWHNSPHCRWHVPVNTTSVCDQRLTPCVDDECPAFRRRSRIFERRSLNVSDCLERIRRVREMHSFYETNENNTY